LYSPATHLHVAGYGNSVLFLTVLVKKALFQLIVLLIYCCIGKTLTTQPVLKPVEGIV
jgi:hypothetical protein